ncbi:hypothetical protein O1L60_03500 [Streptomyces diastatochromogenes]|nr:hypothetical protein [Streptomyces diastatochromogenes]
MTSTRRVLGTIALLAALGGIAACGPEDPDAQGVTGGSGAGASPSGTASVTSAPARPGTEPRPTTSTGTERAATAAPRRLCPPGS